METAKRPIFNLCEQIGGFCLSRVLPHLFKWAVGLHLIDSSLNSSRDKKMKARLMAWGDNRVDVSQWDLVCFHECWSHCLYSLKATIEFIRKRNFLIVRLTCPRRRGLSLVASYRLYSHQFPAKFSQFLYSNENGYHSQLNWSTQMHQRVQS